MKYPLYAFLIIILSLNALHAADKPLTAFEVLKMVDKQLGDPVGKNLLRMEAEYAKLRPREWWIRYYDASLSLKVRAIRVIGSEINRNVEPGNIFDGGNVEYVIQPDQLKYDSEKCIAFMEKAARENNIPLHSLHMRLEKPFPGESNPIWHFEWLDAREDSLGKISVSATTGKVTEIVGLKIREKRFQGVSKTTFPQDVEETFLGIGGDMEEFFTGERTIDKEAEPIKDRPKEKKKARD